MMKKSAIGLFVSVVVSPVFAGLEFIEYADTDNETKLLSNFSNVFINNQSDLELFVASGLDRKLRVKVLKGGTEVEQTTTSVINTNDRISKEGRDFYGKIVDLQGVNNDGTYSISIETLSLTGEVVATDTYELVRDTVPPVINDNDITWVRNGWSFGNIEHFSYTDSSLELRLNSLSEERSGLSHVDYFISTPERLAADPLDKSVLEARLNKDSEFVGNATITAAAAVHPNVAPNQDLYTIGFQVYDKAGNSATIKRNSHIDNLCPAAPSIEVYNSRTSQWEPYSSNMTIHQNPIKIRWGRDVSTFENGSNAPYGWVKDHNVSQTIGTKAYYERTLPIPQDYSYFYFYTRAGEVCHRQTLSSFKFAFADGVDKAPVGGTVWYKTNLPEHKGEWIKSTSPKYNKPYTITAVRHFAEARSYRQKAWGTDIPVCYIEPGQTFCDSNTSISYSSGRGYSPKTVYLDNADGGLQVHYGYVYTYWDMNDPKIVSVTVNPELKRVISKSHDPDTVSDWRKNMWKISKVEAVIDSLDTADSYRLSPIESEQLDIRNREDSFDLSQLKDGTYEVTVVATDTYGNVGQSQEPVSFKVDNTAPEIEVKYRGVSLPETIVDLRDLTFSLSDFSSAVVVSGRLHGSSSNENVFLGVVNQGNNVFSFEQPKIFPTLLEGESYSLEVIAEDEFKNKQTEVITFKYMPENLIEMETQTYLGVSHRLYDENDMPLARIFSEAPLKIDEGMMATGVQNAYITNRTDSDISVKLVLDGSELEVSPGETKEIQVDLGNTGKNLSIEVYPATAHAGKASLMFDIPQLTSKFN
ncbi:DUF4165 domain-containing protein [Vibrio parahaemolyticus]|nr:DUF4165 domain-containing protein [Vibrio parahaemolyticus]